MKNTPSTAPLSFADFVPVIALAYLVLSVLGISFLNSDNWPTGGDAASHVLYAWLYADELLLSGHLTPWVPEVFGGLPFLSYYFPLPFVVIALLSKVIGFAPAFKWGGFLAAILLPGAIYIGSRTLLRFTFLPSLFAALGGLAFLLHEQNSIWGGNLLSTLAGEFSYSYGMLFAVLASMAWARVASSGRGWVLAAVLEAACGFSHGFPLLIVGFSTAYLLLEANSRASFWRIFRHLSYGHLLAFSLLGIWLWPMLEMHSLTIPNDASFPLTGWADLLPKTLWPLLALGSAAVPLFFSGRMRALWQPGQLLALRYFFICAMVAAFAFIIGDRIGLADIRFFPLVWLFAMLICGWLLGQALLLLPLLIRNLLALSCVFLIVGWLADGVQEAPEWGFWNHSGLDAKPQWNNLKTLFPAMRGELWSPRLLFEHDPDNNDLGSTRSLEALPIFLNHRPVLEGLYMESALLGPAVYLVQSEVSARPSSPLVRFPGGSLDPEFAAQHMNFLHADTLLLRSERARLAIEQSGLFKQIAEAPPFALYQLRQFNSALLAVVQQPIKFLPRENWMENSFEWFRTRSRFTDYLPVYGDPFPILNNQAQPAHIENMKLMRHELVFETNAIGQPHLLKMAFHPRWQLATKGQMRIAGPGYLLIVPEENEIRLVYGKTRIGELGTWASLSAALCIAYFCLAGLKRKVCGQPLSEPDNHGSNPPRLMKPFALSLSKGFCGSAFDGASTSSARTVLFHAKNAWLRALATALLILGLALYFSHNAPERAYARGWSLLDAGQHSAASREFQIAYEKRPSAAKKEEALFWLARASQQAGEIDRAREYFRLLTSRYHGYWLPESLYTLAELERQAGHEADALDLAQRLKTEYPNTTWALKLEKQP
jgi:hypothetical protein